MIITKQEAMARLQQDFYLVYSRTNPSTCYCGWYSFYYEKCDHKALKSKKLCERTEGVTGFVFCPRKPPCIDVSEAKIAGLCSACTRAQQDGVAQRGAA